MLGGMNTLLVVYIVGMLISYGLILSALMVPPYRKGLAIGLIASGSVLGLCVLVGVSLIKLGVL